MTEYKIGQILTANQDIEVEMALSGDKKFIPKGSKAIVGADNFAHHLRGGVIQPLGSDVTIKGYDTTGISEYLIMSLKDHFPILDMLDSYDIAEKEFQNEIEYALDDMGM